jgi:DNA-binding CsgD family transcriptional regulator
MAACELWDDDAIEAIAKRMENAARERGALYALQRALLSLAACDLRAGRFELSESRYAEVQDIAVAVGGFPEFFGLLNVELLAWQGDDTAARSTALMLADVAGNMMGLASSLTQSQLAMATLEIAQGNYGEAFEAAKAAVDAQAIGWSIKGYPDLIEAAARSGRQAMAEAALDEFALQALATGTPVALGLLARSRGLVANDASSNGHFDESLDHLSRSVRTPELARTHLVYGEWLRRKKQRSLARDHLRAAYESFISIGAGAFAERARRELMATGERARQRQPDTTRDLTPREYQIAQLAASRATSREIAAQLFITSNTVEYHLRKVFQKLGVTSRRQLSSVLPSDPSEHR